MQITNMYPQDKNICPNTVQVETCRRETSSFPGFSFLIQGLPSGINSRLFSTPSLAWEIGLPYFSDYKTHRTIKRT